MKYVGLYDNDKDIVTKEKLDAAVPTKTSQLENDSGFITSAPVTSVNTKTGAVELTASDVGAQASITASGILKGDGAGVVSAAVANMDYATCTNLVNGSANGSLRTVNAAQETYSYTLGENAFAEGVSYAKGNTSHAEGSASAIGEYSHAEGESATANGTGSHAEGYQASAYGDYSHAEGRNSISNGSYAHAEGNISSASGIASHAEGGSKATGNYSHSEGIDTVASGVDSHAEGEGTTASGENSHSEGSGTTANHKSQHTQGEYNIADDSTAAATARGNYAHIVGNGTSDRKRSNAHTLDWSGNAWFAGDVYVGSTSGKNKDDGSKKLITADEVPKGATYSATLAASGWTTSGAWKTQTVSVTGLKATYNAAPFVDVALTGTDAAGDAELAAAWLGISETLIADTAANSITIKFPATVDTPTVNIPITITTYD